MSTASNTTINTLNFINLNPASPAYVLKDKGNSSNNNTTSTTSFPSNSGNVVQEYPKASLCFMMIFTLLLCTLMVFMYYRPSKKGKKEENFPVTYE